MKAERFLIGLVSCSCLSAEISEYGTCPLSFCARALEILADFSKSHRKTYEARSHPMNP